MQVEESVHALWRSSAGLEPKNPARVRGGFEPVSLTLVDGARSYGSCERHTQTFFEKPCVEVFKKKNEVSGHMQAKRILNSFSLKKRGARTARATR
jgi:hypothetical protein